MLLRFCLVVFLAVCSLPAFAENAQNVQTLDSIVASVRDFLTAAQSGTSAPSSIAVDALDPRLRLSACATPLEVSFAPGSRSTGQTVVLVHCPTPRPWSLYVPAKIAIPVFVVVVTRPMSRDQVISASDIAVEQRNAGDLSGTYLTDPNQVLGKVVTRFVAAGSVLSSDQLQTVRVIHRGDRVTLLVQGAGLAVRSVGIALADAGVGDHVSVRNESSQRIVEGIVNKDGAVVMGW